MQWALVDAREFARQWRAAAIQAQSMGAGRRAIEAVALGPWQSSERSGIQDDEQELGHLQAREGSNGLLGGRLPSAVLGF